MIDDIVNRVSLVDIIGRYVDLKKAGKNYVGKCPFHNDKNPSFSVSDEKGFYHCFSCKASGNAIKFLMEYKKQPFMETMEELAKMAGVELQRFYSPDEVKEKIRKDRLYKMNQDAMTYYHNLLRDGQMEGARFAAGYVQKRKITPEMVRQFRLGYGGDAWDGLYQHMKAQGYKDAELMSASLISRNKSGGYFDRFKGRLIFPIQDIESRIVGFGGRILRDEEKVAKYLNTSENALFHKSRELFGLNFAVEEIKKLQTAILTEGYMDVLACHQFGVTNVVAPLGTAFTEQQLIILKRYSEEVWFTFDGDAAGLKAANRALDIAVKADIRQMVVILPEGEDPYDFLMKRGRDEFIEYTEQNKLTPIHYKLRYFSGLINHKKDKVKFLNAIFPYIAEVDHAVVAESYLEELSRFLMENIAVIREEYNRFRHKRKDFGGLIEGAVAEQGKASIENTILSMLIDEPILMDEIGEIVAPEMFRNLKNRKIFELIQLHPDKNTKELLTLIEDELIIQHATEYSLNKDSMKLNPYEAAYRLKQGFLMSEQKKAAQLADQYENEKNMEMRDYMHQVLMELKVEEKSLIKVINELND